MKKQKYIIAVDFDNTLAMTDFPTIIEPNEDLINLCIKLREKGFYVVLWTCRNGQYLEDAVNYLKKFGLEFDAINDDVDFVKDAWKENRSKKIVADIYIDDNALNAWNEDLVKAKLNDLIDGAS